MRTWRLLKQSMIALERYRLRTSLVMLGVLIGITALTVVVGMTKAAGRQVMERVNNFGPTAIMVFSGGGRNLPGGDPSAATLTMEDVGAIEAQIRGLTVVSPMLNRGGRPVSYLDRSTEISVMGAAPDWQEAWDWYVETGEFFDERDYGAMARVAVIGQTAARELFAGENPIGESIRLGNASFQVKGLLSARGTSPTGGDMDSRIIIPLTTAMRRTFNTNSLTLIRLRVGSVNQLEQTASEVRALLRERHRIAPPTPDDFRVVTPDVISGLSQMVSGTLNQVLLAVTVLSLLVGGIVLMNLMLLSVTERRHEIGLRRALGGRSRDILLQFLFESLAVTTAGGAAGLVLGVVIALGLRASAVRQIELSWEPAILALSLSLLVGLVFGLLPARRAAAMSPVQALR